MTNVYNLRTLSVEHALAPFLGLLDVDKAAYAPVAETEGVGHGVPDIGPTDDGDWDPNDGIENCYNFSHGRLWCNVPVACRGRNDKMQ